MLLSAVEYPAIRAAIDVSLDASTLPDSTIGLPVFHAAAESEVAARIAGAQALVDAGGETARRIKNAVIFLTAARLVRRIPQITRDAFATISVERRPFDPDALERDLRGQAEGLIALVVAPNASRILSPPTFVRLAPGGRGKVY